MPSFSQQFQNHLDKYKVRRLGVKQPGVFIYRGETLRKQHILPKELQWLNIVEPYRAEVQDFVKRHSTLKLHRKWTEKGSEPALRTTFSGTTQFRMGLRTSFSGLANLGQPSSRFGKASN